jgi:hypothetical protein
MDTVLSRRILAGGQRLLRTQTTDHAEVAISTPPTLAHRRVGTGDTRGAALTATPLCRPGRSGLRRVHLISSAAAGIRRAVREHP